MVVKSLKPLPVETKEANSFDLECNTALILKGKGGGVGKILGLHV